MGFPIGEIQRPNQISHNAGIITVANLLAKIGGRTFFKSSLTRTIATDVTLVANTRYQVFAVESGGAVQLRISPNENSVGPAGFTAWDLIGSFQANGLGSVAFGAFINIDGVPKFSNVPVTPTLTGFGVPTTTDFSYDRLGADLIFRGTWTSGTTTAVEPRISLPGVTHVQRPTNWSPGYFARNNAGGAANSKGGPLLFQSNSAFGYVLFSESGNVWSGNNSQWNLIESNATTLFAATDFSYLELVTQVNEWSNTPIRDL